MNAVLASHFGTWEGKSVHVDPDGKVLDSYNTKIEIGARGEKCSQRNTYTRPDGQVIVKEFKGIIDTNGTLTLEREDGTQIGKTTTIDDRVLIFSESIQTEDGPVLITEVITLCDEDKKNRMRTNQFVINGKPYKTSTIVEQLVSKEDVYFEI